MINYSNDTSHSSLLNSFYGQFSYRLRWLNHAFMLVEKEVFKAKRINLFDCRKLFMRYDMELEQWKDIPGQEGRYQISNLGRVKGLPIKTKFGNQAKIFNERICIPYLSKIGYSVVCFGKNKKAYLHRLIATAFIPNPENKPTVNHKDGNKQNNKIENLEWATYQENVKHAFKHGLMVGKPRHGSDNPYCKIPFETVEKIRAEKGLTTLDSCAKKYSISLSHVWQIQNNKNRTIK